MLDIIMAGRGCGIMRAAVTAARAGLTVGWIPSSEGHEAEDFAVGGATRQLQEVWPPVGDWVRNHITFGRIISPSGHALELRHPDGGYIVSMRELEIALAKEAAVAGVKRLGEFEAKRLIRDTSRFSEIEGYNKHGKPERHAAKAFIFSPSAARQIDRQTTILLPPSTHYYVQYYLPDQTLPQHLMEVYVGHEVASGSYVWVISWGDIGGVVLGWGLPVGAYEVKDIQVLLERFIEQRASQVPSKRAVWPMPPLMSPDMMVDTNLLVVSEQGCYSGFLPSIDIGGLLQEGVDAASSVAEYLQDTSHDLNGLRFGYLAKLTSRTPSFDRLVQVRRVVSDISDAELDDLIVGVKEVAGSSRIGAIDPLPTLLRVIKRKPRLWKLARFLF